MNNCKIIAKHICVLITLFIVVLVIIFPIFLSVKLNFSTKEQILKFKIYLFGIRVLLGYAKILKEGIIFHLTKKTALLLQFKSILSIKDKVKPLQDYHLLVLKLNFNIGAEDKILNSIGFCFLLKYFESFIQWFLTYKKPYFLLKNNCNLYLDETYSSVDLYGRIVFNLLMILLSIIKILTGKLKNALSK